MKGRYKKLFSKHIIIFLKYCPFHKLFYRLILIYKKNRKYARSDTLYHFSKSILEYIGKNKIDIKEFNKKLDQDSKKIIKKNLKIINYVYNNKILDSAKFLNKEEIIKIFEINEKKNTYEEQFKLPINHYEPSIFYYNCGLIFLPLNIIKSLKNKDFIDAGAYIGDSALIFEKYYEPQKVYAFEPEPKNYNFMIKTIQMNQLKKIVPIKKGLGDKKGILKIDSKGLSSSISNKGDKDVKIITIDTFVFKNNLSVGLIKMDIEGFELNALRGAEKTIKKFKPILLISIYHNGEQFFETAEYIQKINPNYKYIIRKLDPSNFFLETELIAWNDDSLL